VKSDVVLDADSIRVLERAKETIGSYYQPGTHHVACALLCKSGKIYDGIHLDCAGYDTCAEPTAIAQAMLAREEELLLVSAVMINHRTGEAEVINPCGNCLQHFCAFAPNIEIIADTGHGLQRLPLASLMPYPYSPAT
jgi:cytidine deaminase